MNIIDSILTRFGCRHKHRSIPFTDEKLGTYTVCLDCGKKFKFEWAEVVKDHPYLREEVHA